MKTFQAKWSGSQRAEAGSATLTNRLALGIMIVSVVVAAAVFLWPSPVEFPLDDAYIHFTYAENLARHGGLYFNDAAEQGVGTSSILWVLLLAGGDRAGVPIKVWAKLLGVGALVGVMAACYWLLQPMLPPGRALAAALLVGLSGNMAWFALNGMETMLFLALGLAAACCYRAGRWAWLGGLLGLLILTRIEGALLLLVIGAFDIARRKGVGRGLLVTAVLAGMMAGPWFAYLFRRTGHLLPTSGIGKHISFVLAIQVAAAHYGLPPIIGRLTGLAYPLTLTAFGLEYVLGGAALPPPYLHLNLGVGVAQADVSVWAVIGWVSVIGPLLWMSGRRLAGWLRRPGWLGDEQRLPLIILLIWMAVHNLTYMAYLPSIGAAGRYAAINLVGLWIGLALAVWLTRGPGRRLWLGAGLVAMALAGTLFWNRVYDANIEHMLNVRVAAAEYVMQAVAPEETCAAMDIGAARYFGQRRVVDLGGLVDPTLARWYLAGELDQYLIEHQVTCLILPGRAGSTTDGLFDIARELGLTGSRRLSLRPEQVFQIERERWLLGYLPVMNYQATVTVYRIDRQAAAEAGR